MSSIKAVPVCVYVVFFPSPRGEAAEMADEIFRWLRLMSDESDATAMGLPVYFRCTLTGGTLSPPMKWDEASDNFVLVLVDDAMTTRKEWRNALRTLCDEAQAASTHRVHMLPVMLDRSFDQLAFLALRHQPIRVFDPDDPALPPASEEPAAKAAHAEAERAHRARRIRRLRRGVTENIVRLVRAPSGEDQTARLEVFISHAKADGLKIAKALRDGFASVGQLQPWFDANGLSGGRNAARAMATAAATSSGGMVAVLSDAYPYRPWCRFEAQLARTPRRQVNGRLYTVQPTVAVEIATDRWSRAVGAMSQVHRIGWPSTALPDGGRIADVVDRLLLEVLMAEVMRRSAGAHQREDRVILDFVPDAWALTEIRLQERKQPVHEVVYPGHTLRRAERVELMRVATSLFGDDVRLRPLEDVIIEPPAPRTGAPRLVALSAGGVDEELWLDGVGSLHINDLVLRLTRHLLTARYHVAYGGTLTNVKNNHTIALLDAAEGWRADLAFELDRSEEDRIREANAALENPPTRNYAAWPHSRAITPETAAAHLGLCEFISIDPPGEYGDPPRRFDELEPAVLEEHKALLEADALSSMRRKMAEDCDARVLFAGKTHGAAGWLPGIAEELLMTIRAGKPLLLLGRFGGCSKLLADWLLDPGATWPSALTYDGELAWRKQGRRDRAWLQGGTSETARRDRYDELQRELSAFKERLLDPDDPPAHQLPLDVWRDLNAVTSATPAIGIVLQSLAKLWP